MLQRDYFLRIIQEFMAALSAFMERRRDAASRDRALRDLYRQYVGPYDTLARLSTADTLHYAADQWPDTERIERLAMLAELLYTEATYSQAPLNAMLYERAYQLYDYVETHGDTYSIDRHAKMAAIRQMQQMAGGADRE